MIKRCMKINDVTKKIKMMIDDDDSDDDYGNDDNCDDCDDNNIDGEYYE